MPEQSDNLNHDNLPELGSRIAMNENAELLTKKKVNLYWTPGKSASFAYLYRS